MLFWDFFGGCPLDSTYRDATDIFPLELKIPPWFTCLLGCARQFHTSCSIPVAINWLLHIVSGKRTRKQNNTIFKGKPAINGKISPFRLVYQRVPLSVVGFLLLVTKTRGPIATNSHNHHNHGESWWILWELQRRRENCWHWSTIGGPITRSSVVKLMVY